MVMPFIFSENMAKSNACFYWTCHNILIQNIMMQNIAIWSTSVLFYSFYLLYWSYFLKFFEVAWKNLLWIFLSQSWTKDQNYRGSFFPLKAIWNFLCKENTKSEILYTDSIKINRPDHNIRRYWTNFWKPTVHVQ